MYLNASKRQIMTWFTKMTCFDERLANEVVDFVEKEFDFRLATKPRTQNDPDLRLKKMFKYVVSARFLVSF